MNPKNGLPASIPSWKRFAPAAKSIKSGLPSRRRKTPQPIIAEAKKAGIIVQICGQTQAGPMADGVAHQGVVAQAAAYRYFEMDELLERVRGAAKCRSCCCLTKSRIRIIWVDFADCRMYRRSRRHYSEAPLGVLTATVSKISAGAVEYVPVARVTNMAQTIDRLKEEASGLPERMLAQRRMFSQQTSLDMPLAL